jgi:hypothetical protein
VSAGLYKIITKEEGRRRPGGREGGGKRRRKGEGKGRDRTYLEGIDCGAVGAVVGERRGGGKSTRGIRTSRRHRMLYSLAPRAAHWCRRRVACGPDDGREGSAWRGLRIGQVAGRAVR